MSKLPETFCPNPWVQICATPMSALAVCGESREARSDIPLAQFFNSPELKSLRASLARGERPAHCETCWTQEREGRHSTRQHTLADVNLCKGPDFLTDLLEESKKNGFEVPFPTKVDIKLGSQCNLACRMCSADNSVKLWREYADNTKDLVDFADFYENARPLYERPPKPPSIEEWISISPEITDLNISGGEPNMLKGVQEYLEVFHAKGFSENVNLTFNTNGTIANWSLYGTLKKFKQVDIYISIDGTDSIYEYIRYPAKWPDLQASVLLIKEFFKDATNVNLYVSPTYQVLNVLHLTDLYRWCDSVGLEWVADNVVTDPHFYSPSILSKAIRELAADRIEKYMSEKPEITERQDYGITNIVNHLRAQIPCDDNHVKTFAKHTLTLDKIRSQKFANSCPELHGLLKQHHGL